MYFPYLRGRQFEIIAVRELLEKGLITGRIIPIIEPVKLSSTLVKTMNLFAENNRSLVVVSNPKVGSFEKDLLEANKVDISKKYNSMMASDKIIKGHIVNENSEAELAELADIGVDLDDIISISFKRDELDNYRKSFEDITCTYNLIPDDRKYGRVVKNNKVLFADRFQKRKRNVDYYNVDEFFSEDHYFFRDEGFEGFSDFTVVGDEYSTSGFAPFSVAIHFVYFKNEEEMNIIHFVSESNEDIRNPGGKFYEAVEKLYEWGKDKDIKTFGYNELIGHYRNKTYPGLGVVKKLCIMHHIELISQYFEGALQ